MPNPSELTAELPQTEAGTVPQVLRLMDGIGAMLCFASLAEKSQGEELNRGGSLTGKNVQIQFPGSKKPLHSLP